MRFPFFCLCWGDIFTHYNFVPLPSHSHFVARSGFARLCPFLALPKKGRKKRVGATPLNLLAALAASFRIAETSLRSRLRLLATLAKAARKDMVRQKACRLVDDCLQDGVGLVASRFTLIAYTTTLPAASAVRTGLDIFPCRFSKRFEQASPNFVMSAASLPEVRHRSPAQPVLEAVPNKTENSRRTKPSSRALRSEAEHRSGLRAGFQRACPLARFLGSFFGVRQRMNINNKPRARVRRTQCERK